MELDSIIMVQHGKMCSLLIEWAGLFKGNINIQGSLKINGAEVLRK